MAELTATAAEARANFSKIANEVSTTGRPVTVLKNSRPWVTINPITEDSPVVGGAWSQSSIIKIDENLGYAILPSEWDEPEDDGLYDEFI